jgi:hypothetical protein
MAVYQLSDPWTRYRSAVDRFVVLARPVLDGDRRMDDDSTGQIDGVLGEVAEASQALREVGEDLLQRRLKSNHDEVSLLLLAAATVDSTVANVALSIDPEPLELNPEYAERARAVEPEYVERGLVAPEPARPESLSEVITEANALFELPTGGPRALGAAEVDRAQLHNELVGDLDRLVDLARGPAMRFSFGALSSGGAALIPFPAVHVPVELDVVAARAGRIKRHAVRLLGESVRKLLAIVGEYGIDHMLDRLRRVLGSAAVWTLHGVCGYPSAARRVSAVMERSGDLLEENLASVIGDVSSLTTSYKEQMKWTARIAGGIGLLAPFISTLAAPVGLPLVLGLNGVGLGFVTYTLTVRLDGHPLPSRVEGIATIVERL